VLENRRKYGRRTGAYRDVLKTLYTFFGKSVFGDEATTDFDLMCHRYRNFAQLLMDHIPVPAREIDEEQELSSEGEAEESEAAEEQSVEPEHEEEIPRIYDEHGQIIPGLHHGEVIDSSGMTRTIRGVIFFPPAGVRRGAAAAASSTPSLSAEIVEDSQESSTEEVAPPPSRYISKTIVRENVNNSTCLGFYCR
jgi:hypothetical protein